MSKIKSIDISYFRVYEDRQHFSFDGFLGLSNLVVIYAPNGYGKTSFFDAVEWCYSGKISRFEHEQIHKEIEKREYSKGDQILLTNRKSYLIGKSGEIKINLEDGKSITRTVQRRRITGHDTYFDYRQGVLTGSYREQEISKLKNTNILTQDQIDSFLRYTSPEDKFNGLKEFWPEGESATRTYKNLLGYIRVLDNELTSLATRKKDINKQVKQYLNTGEHVKAVNSQIAGLTEISVIGFQMAEINHPVDDAVYQSIRDVASSFTKIAERQQEINNVKKTRLKELIEGFAGYEATIKSIITGQTDLLSLQNLEKMFAEQRSENRIVAELNQTLLPQNARLSQYNALLAILPEHLKIRENISKEELLVTKLLEENEHLLNNIATYNNSLMRLESNRSELVAKKDNLAKLIEQVDENFKQFDYWTKIRNDKNRELEALAKPIQAINEKIETQNKRRRQLSEILEVGDYGLFTEADLVALDQPLKNIRQQTDELRLTESLLLERQNEYNRSGSLDENLDRMITWGEEYVSALDVNHCPLCKSEFDSVAALLEQIRAEKKAVFKVTQLKENIDSLAVTRGKLTDEIELNKLVVERYLTAQSEVCRNVLEALHKESNILSNTQLDLKNTIERGAEMADQYLDHLREYQSEIEQQGPPNPDIIKKEMAEKSNIFAIMITRMDELLTKKRDMILAGENRLATSQNQVASLRNAIQLAKSQKLYLEAEGLIENLKLLSADITSERLNANASELKAALDKNVERIRIQQNKLNDIKNRIAAHPLKVGEEEIPSLKVDQQNNVRSLELAKKSFEELYHSTITDDIIAIDAINVEKDANDKLLTGLESELARLSSFSIQVDLINENVQKNKLEQELIQINDCIPELRSAREKLVSAREAASTYIDRAINNYFNKDVINQIYSRIEPHPDLNQIDFIPEITGRGPSLNVKAVSKTDNVNPVLYLSAGQLNVLSLSIFLAKAFEVGSEKISTIFMDDPVQNLSDINILSFIDLIRSMITTYDRQVVISTHDEHFFKLIQHKMPAEAFSAKYLELGNFGKVKTQEIREN